MVKSWRVDEADVISPCENDNQLHTFAPTALPAGHRGRGGLHDTWSVGWWFPDGSLHIELLAWGRAEHRRAARGARTGASQEEPTGIAHVSAGYAQGRGPSPA